MNFWENIFFASWFFLPAGLANLFPIFAAHTPVLRDWNQPVDFNRTFRGKRIFGNNKTIRGFAVGIIVAILIVWFQKYTYSHWPYAQSLFPIDYGKINPFIWGTLLALGALGGDAVKSFFKRQMDVPPGESLLFFDQLDYVFGVIAVTYFYKPLNPEQYLYIAGVWFVIHILTTIIGYLAGLKQKPI